MVTTNQQYCTFWLENQFLGIDAQQVQEVIRAQEMTDVPLSNTCIRGLINLRGQIVTAIELRTLFSLESRRESVAPMNVVVRTADGPVSLLVDKIGDVINAADLEFENPPETTPPEAKKLIFGSYKLRNELLQIVNLDEIISSSSGT